MIEVRCSFAVEREERGQDDEHEGDANGPPSDWSVERPFDAAEYFEREARLYPESGTT